MCFGGESSSWSLSTSYEKCIQASQKHWIISMLWLRMERTVTSCWAKCNQARHVCNTKWASQYLNPKHSQTSKHFESWTLWLFSPTEILLLPEFKFPWNKRLSLHPHFLSAWSCCSWGLNQFGVRPSQPKYVCWHLSPVHVCRVWYIKIMMGTELSSYHCTDRT